MVAGMARAVLPAQGTLNPDQDPYALGSLFLFERSLWPPEGFPGGAVVMQEMLETQV